MNIRIKGDTVEIEGYVNAVERLSKPLSDRLGTFVERIKAGAFAKALERAEDVRILLNHEDSRDLGGISDGNLELYEDAIGLHARATIKDPEVVCEARNGDLVGWSFGFQDRDVEKGEENGIAVRNVRDLDLFEVSLIDRNKIPAYDGTLVAVRTAETTLNISEVMEVTPKVEEIEERAEEIDEQDNEHADDKGAVDYTKYQNIINEMKGD